MRPLNSAARWLVLIVSTSIGLIHLVRCELLSSDQQKIFCNETILELHQNQSSLKPQKHQLEAIRSPESNQVELVVVAANSAELQEIKSSKNANDEKFVEAGEIAMHFDKEKISKLTPGEFLQMGLIAQVQSSAYSDKFIHRYETYEEMKLANGPEVDNAKCVQQLEQILARTQASQLEGYNSKDIDVYSKLDLWGRRGSGFMLGHLFFEGNYDECVSSKTKWTEAGNRYCVMKYKLAGWNQIDRHDVISLSAGVCLPKTCDSARYKNKYQLISAIMKSQYRKPESEQSRMVDLYCLPDAESQLRSVWRSPKSALTLICVSLWMSLLMYATYRHNQLTRMDKGDKEEPEQSLTNRAKRGRANLFRMLSITNNFRSLFDTGRGSTPAEPSPKGPDGRQTDCGTEPTGEKVGDSPEQLDLRCIEGIKVIAMCYIIMGHVLMCMPTIMKNGRQLAEQGVYSIAFLTANLVPAFAVNSFFAITGILTSYLVFKQNKQQRLITSPPKWTAFILFRYLRIMPMYALAVLYCKTLAKFAGSGPLWDYGTSALAQRRACEQEHWKWTLTFTSNFLSPMEHCIPGGWYLSNDFQFFLVTPIYVAALYWKPRLGKLLLYASIVAGYVAGFLSIYNSDVQDLRPIASFSPSGFKTYVSHLSFNYTHPQYRIPAYLIGLLVGYKMYCLEEERRKFYELPAKERQGKEAPTWSEGFRKYIAYTIAYMVITSILTPVFGLLIPFSKTSARIMVSLITPSFHVQFSYLISAFIMLAATGDANKPLTRFLSSSLWKPFARLSLCVLLVNVEVINYIIQSSTRQQYVTNGSLVLLNLGCTLASFAVATVVCGLFEAPVRSALNLIIIHTINKASKEQKISLKGK